MHKTTFTRVGPASFDGITQNQNGTMLQDGDIRGLSTECTEAG
jgi:hypothetical protein